MLTQRVLIAATNLMPGELNFASMNVLLDAKDHVITVSPCYQSLSEVVKSIGCTVSYWTPNTEDWEFNYKDLDKFYHKNPKQSKKRLYSSKKKLDKIIK